MNEEAVEQLTAELTEMVQDIQRTHRVSVALTWAAICFHVEAGHDGPWYAVPEGTRCQNEDCLLASTAVIEVDEWLADKRDFLDIKVSQ